MRCTVLANSDEVVLHDEGDEIVPVVDSFTREGTRCTLGDPDVLLVVAGPRRDGRWVSVLLDAEPRPTVH